MATTSPAVSVLTPVWNGLPYIKECVDSVLAQTFQDWELIVSDNCSTDGTREYLDTIKDPRVRIFKQEQNLGISRNLNFLFLQASAPTSYILCADDYFYPGSLDKVLKEWSNAEPTTAFIGFNWKEVLNYSLTARRSYELLPKKLHPSDSRLAFFLFGNVLGNLSNVSVKVDLVNKSGGFSSDFRLACDFEIWSRLTRDHSMVLSDESTCYVRAHEGTASNYMTKMGIMWTEQIALYERLIKELKDEYDYDKLVTYFNIQVSSFHMRESLKGIVHGRFRNIKMYFQTASPIVWSTWKRIFLGVPYAVFQEGRFRHLVRMAEQFMVTKRKVITN